MFRCATRKGGWTAEPSKQSRPLWGAAETESEWRVFRGMNTEAGGAMVCHGFWGCLLGRDGNTSRMFLDVPGSFSQTCNRVLCTLSMFMRLVGKQKLDYILMFRLKKWAYLCSHLLFLKLAGPRWPGGTSYKYQLFLLTVGQSSQFLRISCWLQPYHTPNLNWVNVVPSIR